MYAESIIPGLHTLTPFSVLVRFPYTQDTYNNPQNVWTFVSVSSIHYIFERFIDRDISDMTFFGGN
jgi:hypothetical protein